MTNTLYNFQSTLDWLLYEPSTSTLLPPIAGGLASKVISSSDRDEEWLLRGIFVN